MREAVEAACELTWEEALAREVGRLHQLKSDELAEMCFRATYVARAARLFFFSPAQRQHDAARLAAGANMGLAFTAPRYAYEMLATGHGFGGTHNFTTLATMRDRDGVQFSVRTRAGGSVIVQDGRRWSKIVVVASSVGDVAALSGA